LYKRIHERSGDKEPERYLIGEVSQKVNLSQKTIREYEKIGLVKPQKDQRY